MTGTGYLVIAAVIVTAAAVTGWHVWKTRRTIGRLEQMLDAAMKGSFTEGLYDESMLSALESRFAQYLAATEKGKKELQAEQDTIKTLIADISHQTKTPIANLLLYTQLLGEHELEPESRSCVASLEGQAKKLQVLIEALVKTSRLEAGIITLHPVPGNTDAVLQAAVSQLLPKAQAKGILLEMETRGAEAVFDPKWTEEALVNLVDNAVKYTPDGGKVHISTVEYDLFTCIRVEDTGPGIPEEDMPKVFQRFYRGTAHAAQEGVGIGLYLVRRIAQGQGGFVKAGRAAEGGTVFSLYLPRK